MDRTEEIVRIVKSVSKKNETLPEPDESLFDSGFLDSFALPEMICQLEEHFDIEIPDSDLPRKFETIASIDRYVARATAGREG
jgi:acyl carrier protein